MKQKVFEEKVRLILFCVGKDRFRTPLEAAQGYLGAAEETLKLAKQLKAAKRAVKDVKRDIKVVKLIISELEQSDDLLEIEKRLLIKQCFRCHVCEKTFTESDMKVGIMHVGRADTESRYNLCNACYQNRHKISELETVCFTCLHCRNALEHYVLEKTDDGWQCRKPYGFCFQGGE